MTYQTRERDAKQKSLFFSGEIDRHPHGLSGLSFLLPYENDRRFLGYTSECLELYGMEMP